jgi:hypothetical protein
MKKTIVILLGLLFATTGCNDNGSSSSSSNGRKSEIVVTVRQVSFARIEPGDVLIFDGDANKRIIVTEDTAVWRQRESCSGSQDPVAPREVRVGDVLTVFYYTENSQFELSRQVIRPYRIEAFRVDCLEPDIEEESGLTPCQINAILNGEMPCTNSIPEI